MPVITALWARSAAAPSAITWLTKRRSSRRRLRARRALNHPTERDGPQRGSYAASFALTRAAVTRRRQPCRQAFGDVRCRNNGLGPGDARSWLVSVPAACRVFVRGMASRPPHAGPVSKLFLQSHRVALDPFPQPEQSGPGDARSCVASHSWSWPLLMCVRLPHTDNAGRPLIDPMHHVAWLALGRPPRTVAGPTAPIARHGPQRRFPAPLLRPLGEPSRQVQENPRRPLASARKSRCRLGAARALGWRRIAASESRAPRNEPYTDHRCWRTASWGSWGGQPTGK